MTDYFNEAETDAGAGISAGIELAGSQPIGPSDRFHTQLIPDGARVETFDLEELEEKLAAHPRRKRGERHVQDAGSFVAYVEKHGLPETEVYADLSRSKLVGVINAHQGATNGVDDDAGHGDHRVHLELVETDAWKAWTAKDRKAMTQADFAEHLEDRAVDVLDPDSATMLEIAQSLIATTGVDFKQATRLSDGQVQFRYEETVQSKAGQRGDLEIPQTFKLQLSPFEGCPPVELTARFRYRIGSNGLTLFYALLNPADVARDAFIDYVDAVDRAIEQPVFKGRPE